MQLWGHLEEAHDLTLRNHASSSVKGDHDNTYPIGLIGGLNDQGHKNALNRASHNKDELLFLLNQALEAVQLCEELYKAC